MAARWRAQIDDCARGAHLLLWAVIMNILVVCRECGAGSTLKQRGADLIGQPVKLWLLYKRLSATAAWY